MGENFMKRQAGVLLAISSLPGQQGIGDFGKEAYQFIDLLKKSKFRIWQILPLNPLGFGNSPYQPYSSKAMDELYISLDFLHEEGLLEAVPPFNNDKSVTEYQEVRIYKEKYLKAAYRNYVSKKDHKEFNAWVKRNTWVVDYAIFVTFKKHNNLMMWPLWKQEMKNYIHDKKLDLSPYQDEINYEKWLQFVLFSQWEKLHDYAKENGISIMGDLPFYVGIDSLDVWQNQQDFLLNPDGTPSFIAGVPPDYFSRTGQRWGNPIYNWENIKKENFEFWIDRLDFNSQVFDIIRIDHFRAFDTYWKIPESCPTAEVGEWVKAPGYEFFDKLYERLPNINIVAEDLGDLFPSVLELRDHYNLPGMNILQFTFDYNKYEYGNNDRANQIIYTGTHDNETINGWVNRLSEEDHDKLVAKLNRLGYFDQNISKDFIRLALDNIANYALLPMQDILGLGNEARMNTPSTIGSPDWEWKLTSFDKFEDQIESLRTLIERSNRYN